MSWRKYLNNEATKKASEEIKGMNSLKAIKFIQNKYQLSFTDSISFVSCFLKK